MDDLVERLAMVRDAIWNARTRLMQINSDSALAISAEQQEKIAELRKAISHVLVQADDLIEGCT